MISKTQRFPLRRTRSLVSPPIAQVNQLAAQCRAQGADVIDLGQAVLGLAPPRAAIDRVRPYLDSLDPHVYSPDPGLPEVRDAIAHWLQKRKGVASATAAGVMVTCGANQAFANAILTITEPGDEVITFGPGYFDHDYLIALAGCRAIEVPLAVRDGRYRFDLGQVRQALTPKTRCVVLVSPGNPTGAVADRPFVEQLCDLCRAQGIWLVSDETYDLLTFTPDGHCSPASLASHEQVLVLGSFSKIFGLAGWRVGYLAGPDEVVQEAIKVQDGLVVCAPVPGQLAALGAMQQAASFIDVARAELVKRKQALLSAIERWPVLEAREPEGATFVMAKLQPPVDDVTFCRELVLQTGVVAVPGSAFGQAGRGHVRLSYGNQPVPRLEQAAQRMQQLQLDVGG